MSAQPPPYKGWYSDEYMGWAYMHPANDVFPHLPYHPSCPCNPTIDHDNKALIHNSFDGRELICRVERGDKII